MPSEALHLTAIFILAYSIYWLNRKKLEFDVQKAISDAEMARKRDEEERNRRW
jgi:hypothetical protein